MLLFISMLKFAHCNNDFLLFLETFYRPSLKKQHTFGLVVDLKIPFCLAHYEIVNDKLHSEEEMMKNFVSVFSDVSLARLMNHRNDNIV